MLALINVSLDWITNGRLIESIRFLAILLASLGPVIFESAMANSSPPRRDIVSVSRIQFLMRSATWRNKVSPLTCPSESLIFLNLSRSIYSSAVRVFLRCACIMC